METAAIKLGEIPAKEAEQRAVVISDALHDAIVERRLPPGMKLVEAEIGALFDVSRTIVRTALQELSFLGLIRIERNRGAFVAKPSPEEARQIFDARRLVEPGITMDAIKRATSDDLARLRNHLKHESEAMNQRGLSARRIEIRASGDFHLLLASIAGNFIMQRFMSELVARSSLVISLYGQSGASSCGHDDHGEIVEAIAAKNASKAVALTRHHIDHLEADLNYRTDEAIELRQALSL
ncbi:GntR family transcriptional regulator [Phyllobacterium salinisoli]|uniref:GntR family transcriptional regulator n=1 Tax=Phyllobacterium salinisoli TaxID=1899321 RepID=UPI001FDFAFE2|nr:GntR family transcriptional regulator [Phyllobacterium salinisoli]